MTDDKRWKILERITTGWVLIAADADELTKEDCDRKLQEYVDSGQNPGDLKAVLQNETTKVISVVGDFNHLQIESDSIDFAVAWGSLHHSFQLFLI